MSAVFAKGVHVRRRCRTRPRHYPAVTWRRFRFINTTKVVCGFDVGMGFLGGSGFPAALYEADAPANGVGRRQVFVKARGTERGGSVDHKSRSFCFFFSFRFPLAFPQGIEVFVGLPAYLFNLCSTDRLLFVFCLFFSSTFLE